MSFSCSLKCVTGVQQNNFMLLVCGDECCIFGQFVNFVN